MNYRTIGTKLRESRKRLGLTQFDVAEMMGCSRAQVDNIEVARQRAPLHRLEDFARAVGLRVVVQLTPRSEKSVTVRTTGEVAELIGHLNEMSECERKMVGDLSRILPHLPDPIRSTLNGIITLWAERYASQHDKGVETA